jgi:hypothetical protein
MAALTDGIALNFLAGGKDGCLHDMYTFSVLVLA